VEEQEQILREEGQPKNNALPKLSLLVILFCLLIAGVIVFSGQRQNNNQLCDTSANGRYNYQQAAYNIGVTAQKYRANYNNGKGTTANFGGAAITLCPAQGKEYTKYSPIFKGYNYPGNDAPKNSTHSEQQAYGWVISRLTSARLRGGDSIYVTIYSEIPVCILCKADMVTWNADFQALVSKSVKVQTQVWQMRIGSPAAVGKDPVPDDEKDEGFAPKDFPAGTGFPVQYGDVDIVPISFR
jgi:hypothetical protein